MENKVSGDMVFFFWRSGNISPTRMRNKAKKKKKDETSAQKKKKRKKPLHMPLFFFFSPFAQALKMSSVLLILKKEGSFFGRAQQKKKQKKTKQASQLRGSPLATWPRWKMSIVVTGGDKQLQDDVGWWCAGGGGGTGGGRSELAWRERAGGAGAGPPGGVSLRGRREAQTHVIQKTAALSPNKQQHFDFALLAPHCDILGRLE